MFELVTWGNVESLSSIYEAHAKEFTLVNLHWKTKVKLSKRLQGRGKPQYNSS